MRQHPGFVIALSPYILLHDDQKAEQCFVIDLTVKKADKLARFDQTYYWPAARPTEMQSAAHGSLLQHGGLYRRQ